MKNMSGYDSEVKKSYVDQDKGSYGIIRLPDVHIKGLKDYRYLLNNNVSLSLHDATNTYEGTISRKDDIITISLTDTVSKKTKTLTFDIPVFEKFMMQTADYSVLSKDWPIQGFWITLVIDAQKFDFDSVEHSNQKLYEALIIRPSIYLPINPLHFITPKSYVSRLRNRPIIQNWVKSDKGKKVFVSYDDLEHPIITIEEQ